MIQLDLHEARRRRDRGLSQVSGKNMEFIESMRELAVELCRTRGQVTIDDLRELYPFYGDQEPTHPNAYGTIFKDKRFKCLGFTPSKQVQGHGRIIRVWGLR